jgi:hypothetical protein
VATRRFAPGENAQMADGHILGNVGQTTRPS